MKILNLYCGIGGNRKLWDDEHEITSVELDPNILDVYADLYPNDKVVVADAHDFLLKHYDLYDLIWSSPPCPSHGQYRYNVGVLGKGYKPLYPDMKLYEEIIFLKHHFKGKWIVENTIPYYKPLIEPTVNLQRHLIWSNFDIPKKKFESKNIRNKNKISDYDNLGVDLSKYKIYNKRQVLRNCVDENIGKYVLDCAIEK